jgi:Ala-tRNA(Pro) deacylase
LQARCVETVETLLANGSRPATPESVLARLSALGVQHQTVRHAVLRTVSDSKTHRQDPDGGYSKNLFLRNKKGRMWLVTLHEDRMVDLRQLGAYIGAGRVSFASPQRLMRYLGVVPGAVTPLAVINDHGNQVSTIMDSKLLHFDKVHFHPCDNSLTTTLPGDGLLRFMSDCGHTPQQIDFDEFALDAQSANQ